MDYIKIFFDFAPDPREPEGWLSWQHLLFSTLVVLLFVAAAVFCGIRARRADEKYTRRVLVVSTVTMLTLEVIKIVLCCFRYHDPLEWLSVLPLFLCSIMLFSMPIATFGHGRAAQSAADFSFIFGPLCMLAGSYLAANYFSGNAVLSYAPMNSVIEHAISGFFGLFLIIAGRVKIERRRYLDYSIILGGFELLAWLANCMNHAPNPINGQEYEDNYMFFTRDSGTPFSIVVTLTGGNPVLYTLAVASLYFIYMFLVIAVYRLINRLIAKKKA